MDALSIVLVAISCVVCSGVLLAGAVVGFLSWDRRARRGPPVPDDRPGAVVLVAAEVTAGPAPADPAGVELAVDPRDAARTEQLLQELIAGGRLEDW